MWVWGSCKRCDWTKSFLVSGVAIRLLNYSICWITSNQNEALLLMQTEYGRRSLIVKEREKVENVYLLLPPPSLCACDFASI
ncbi:hypothetical protein EGR_11142 [Echinococcus granulosus]|uniref:Uncharacterized protein n=1 Tax=Echinococcus granulosus TaxID=6210 RepID=W6U0P2_ECHGR|nr:hypothetical protein EGR_11142 [Echinococcus granulosus]EUB54001.1 hypothetical protein EGR_11142 [Echinococcus granulosus]